MKPAVCQDSRHHGNTRNMLEAMPREGPIDLADVTARQAVRLEDYDCFGLASGIYAGRSATAPRPLPGNICPGERRCSSSAPAAVPRPPAQERPEKCSGGHTNLVC